MWHQADSLSLSISGIQTRLELEERTWPNYRETFRGLKYIVYWNVEQKLGKEVVAVL